MNKTALTVIGSIIAILFAEAFWLLSFVIVMLLLILNEKEIRNLLEDLD